MKKKICIDDIFEDIKKTIWKLNHASEQKEKTKLCNALKHRLRELDRNNLESSLFRFLYNQNGWFSFDGECSIQAKIKLENGSIFRIGITDDDVAEEKGFWVDIYGLR